MLQQIRTVSVNRISGGKIGEIQDEAIKEKIKQALILYFELD
jgi:mRNA-degrading endonuclease toxin of MazEF toxin-antitoxin module